MLRCKTKHFDDPSMEKTNIKPTKDEQIQGPSSYRPLAGGQLKSK